VGAFALLALLLAGIGIAGVLATSVSRRTQEIGVRLALGARPRTLVTMILRQGLALAAIGLAVGWPVAWMLSRVMQSLLFEVQPRDPRLRRSGSADEHCRGRGERYPRMEGHSRGADRRASQRVTKPDETAKLVSLWMPPLADKLCLPSL
jgi:ABC-type antimicrobial peptide transport system permease subunit